MVMRMENKLWFTVGVVGTLLLITKTGRGIFRELVHEFGKSTDRTRAKGVIAAAASLVKEGTTHPQRITIEFDSGVVTLRGKIGAIEVRNLIGAIENLPGVERVIDQLDVPDPKSRFSKREVF